MNGTLSVPPAERTELLAIRNQLQVNLDALKRLYPDAFRSLGPSAAADAAVPAAALRHWADLWDHLRLVEARIAQLDGASA